MNNETKTPFTPSVLKVTATADLNIKTKEELEKDDPDEITKAKILNPNEK